MTMTMAVLVGVAAFGVGFLLGAVLGVPASVKAFWNGSREESTLGVDAGDPPLVKPLPEPPEPPAPKVSKARNKVK